MPYAIIGLERVKNEVNKKGGEYLPKLSCPRNTFQELVELAQEHLPKCACGL